MTSISLLSSNIESMSGLTAEQQDRSLDLPCYKLKIIVKRYEIVFSFAALLYFVKDLKLIIIEKYYLETMI